MIWKIMKWVGPILLILLAIVFSLLAEPAREPIYSVTPAPTSTTSSGGGAMRF